MAAVAAVVLLSFTIGTCCGQEAKVLKGICAVFGFAEDWFGDYDTSISVSGKHRGSLLCVLGSDLFHHDTRVFDGVALLLASAVAVCVLVVPLGAHSVPEKRDHELPSPADSSSSCVVFSIRLLVVWKADEEGFLELAPFVDEAALEELAGTSRPRLLEAGGGV